ncbi:leucyl aminopeptidase [bacterium]|nr:leucyl aminopeptidase [bacterium]
MDIQISSRTKLTDVVVFMLHEEMETENLQSLYPKAPAEIISEVTTLLNEDKPDLSKGQTYHIRVSNPAMRHIIVMGMGKERRVLKPVLRELVGKATTMILAYPKLKTSQVFIPQVKKLTTSEIIQVAVESSALSDYSFNRYKSEKSKVKMKEITFHFEHIPHDIRPFHQEALVLAESTIIARDLVNEPANVIYPETLANRAVELGKEAGFEVKVFEEKKIAALKMDAYLSVARAAEKRPRLIVMTYNGNPKSSDKVALVGKGLTYDTGGLSLKPTAGMVDMKTDMGGSAAVIGAMRAIALQKLPINVVAVVAAAENSIGGNAYRPGDIIGSMNGKTIEVLNTDAEGRLTLVDAVTYAIRKEKATHIVDVATLTGAVLVALGTSTAGVVTNQGALFNKLAKAGEQAGEQVWKLPYYPEYQEMIKSDIADVKNIGGKYAGSITAGCFVGEFVENLPWVHIDIAGTSWSESKSDTLPKGGTGYGVRLLYHFMKQFDKEI